MPVSTECAAALLSFRYPSNNPAAVSFINLQAKFIYFSYLISDKLAFFVIACAILRSIYLSKTQPWYMY